MDMGIINYFLIYLWGNKSIKYVLQIVPLSESFVSVFPSLLAAVVDGLFVDLCILFFNQLLLLFFNL